MPSLTTVTKRHTILLMVPDLWDTLSMGPSIMWSYKWKIQCLHELLDYENDSDDARSYGSCEHGERIKLIMNRHKFFSKCMRNVFWCAGATKWVQLQSYCEYFKRFLTRNIHYWLWSRQIYTCNTIFKCAVWIYRQKLGWKMGRCDCWQTAHGHYTSRVDGNHSKTNTPNIV
jgi:hypothetical protein